MLMIFYFQTVSVADIPGIIKVTVISLLMKLSH